MIKLSTPLVTTVVTSINGQSQSTVTDTLLISQIQIDFQRPTLRAGIQRGTVVNGVFQPTMTPVNININRDGSFRSDDGSWSGTLNLTALISSLAASFDSTLVQAMPAVGTVA